VIKGKEKGLARKDVRQLADRVDDFWEENAKEPKGLLIINPFRHEPADERKDYYPPDCLEFAKGKKFCLMTTMDLVELLKDYLENKITTEETEQKIMNTTGPIQ